MNIFYLSQKPSRCARWHCDKHVVKMILETAQLLYTAHWVLSGTPDFTTAPFRKGTHERGYMSIKNRKHPSAIWARESLDHYIWLCQLGVALCWEYNHRFGSKKRHGCEDHIHWLYENAPPHLMSLGWRDPPRAMPEEYKPVTNALICYRLYYKEGKKHLLQYTRRHKPHWM